MGEKYDTFMSELEKRGLLSLHGKRAMMHSEGKGGISYWRVSEDDDGKLHAKCDGFGIDIGFTEYEFDDVNRMLKTDSGVLAMPSPRRLADHHNDVFVDWFTLKMKESLYKRLEETGDWYSDRTGIDALTDSVSKSTESIRSDSDKEIRKGCIDMANYAMMLYYLKGNGGDDDGAAVL